MVSAIGEPLLIVAEHVINITNLTGRRDTIFLDTIDHRQR